MTKLKVLVKENSFPVRYNGERFSVGQTFEIDGKHLNKNTMEVLEIIEDNQDDGKESNPFEGKSVEELKAYAEEHGIDIGKATTEEGIIKKIEEAQKTE
ncbi:hypothetical protein MTP04_02670 [Lysinibacillus sp. PLM2]|nr:hypothetical protein MTP04_02670 [Lysinibacillus sp. PLM2]